MKNSEVESVDAEGPQIDKEIFRARLYVTLYTLVVIIAYIVWFGFFVKPQTAVISTDPGVWGQLGDYVGGLLNPIVAYAAFIWLTKGVRLQKVELSETRKALEEAGAAQRKQAEMMQRTAVISAISTQMEALTAEIESRRRHIEFLVGQFPALSTSGRVTTLTGESLTGGEARNLVGSIGKGIRSRTDARERLGKQLAGIVAGMGGMEVLAAYNTFASVDGGHPGEDGLST